MNPRTQERVEQWDSRPFSGGFDGLSDLADSGFSGAVAAGDTWLFMLNGRVVGIFDGAIEDYETASGTVYRAPHPSLPLLCTMEEHGGDVRANYYTNETPLREVDDTLQNGSFTGYIELSENVLSGDYYAVYYGGRRMAAAYIGSAERLITGDEAFDRAADEVGIYEVTDVEIDVTDVPGADGGADAGSDADTDTGTGAGDSDTGSASRAAAASDGSPEPEPDSDPDPTTEPNDSTAPSTTRSSSSPNSTPADDDTAARSEPVADPTESAIEPIDVSDTGPAVSETSITTSEEPASDTDQPAGITTTAETTDAPEQFAGSEATEPEDADGDGTDETDATTVTDAAEPATETNTSSSEPELADVAGDADEPPADQAGMTASPDPAEVAAAAEELEQNDISWLEDGVEERERGRPADGEDPSDDATAAATPETDAERTDSERESGESREPEDQPVDAESESEPESESESTVDSDSETAPDDDQLDQQLEAEEQWRETRSIPSIDPDNTEVRASNRTAVGPSTAEGARPTAADGTNQDSTSRTETEDESTTATRSSQERANRDRQRATSRSGSETDTGTGSDTETDTDADTTADTTTDEHDRQLAKYTRRIEELEAKHDALASKAEELKTERDQLRAEKQELSSTVDQLRSRIERLETELEQARAGSTGSGSNASAAETHLSPAQALSGTNLFVRYDSKSQPTLETAHDGAADRSEVAANLRLEHHTEFDAATVAVDGQPYESFLTETIEYRFVDWLTEFVLYEIRDTGHADGLADLYDAIPRIDRAELGATISLADDDTDDVPDEVTFDVVAFDKMGNPLVLGTFNDSREPASQDLLEELEEAASAVKANYPNLAAAVAVTSSYFEPGALEVAERATSSGFLSRGSKLSYVSLSRKQGYHLCLAESRADGFHVNVPEL